MLRLALLLTLSISKPISLEDDWLIQDDEEGLSDRTWDEAYALARTQVDRLDWRDQAKLGSGIGFGTGPCVGNIAWVPVPGFKGLCLQDSPTGVRFTQGSSAFPASINVAATFDRTLMERNGRLMGEEFRGKGVNVALSPMMNILRAPAGGRNWEGQGADPFLASESARLQVKGIQSQGVIATAKHFIGNEQETGRTYTSSNIDDRTLHDVYLKPFKACVDEGVGAIMCSYNRLNGTYACEDDYTLNTILKGQLGFKGFVMTDWDATRDTDKSANGGTDMMMPGTDFWANDNTWGNNLVNAVVQNRVSPRRLYDIATRILATWYKLGQDNGFPEVNFNSWDPNQGSHVNVQKDHAKHIREVGAASTILVKNSKNVLPLKNNIKVAVFGSDAWYGDSTAWTDRCPDHACSSGTIAQGWGSGTTNFPYVVAPLDGIKNRAAKSGVTVTSMLNDYDMDNAYWTSKAADVSIVFVSADSGEEYLTVQGNKGDRNYLGLWNNGNNLVNKVADGNPNTIVVIHSPGPVDMPWLDRENIVGVVYALFPGQETGNAIADVLFGDVNPSARLPFSINADRSQYSADISKEYNVNYNEGLFLDYRYHDKVGKPALFEFGFGLSYTNFTYSNFALNGRDVTFDIQNTGPLDGHEVPQLYLGFPEYTQSPVKLLKDFDRIFIKKGESTRVKLTMNDMVIWDTPKQQYITPSGEYTVYIGTSSKNILWKTTFVL